MNRTKKTLCELLGLLTLAFFAGPVPSVLAKLSYMNEENMVMYAEIIAIVDISHVERLITKSRSFTYSEIADATVHQTLKGTLPQTVKLYGGTWFTCAQDHFATGRYFVFLVRHRHPSFAADRCPPLVRRLQSDSTLALRYTRFTSSPRPSCNGTPTCCRRRRCRRRSSRSTRSIPGRGSRNCRS